MATGSLLQSLLNFLSGIVGQEEHAREHARRSPAALGFTVDRTKTTILTVTTQFVVSP